MNDGRIYIAGPMYGLPERNYPAFNEAELQWQARNWVVENPVNNGKPPPFIVTEDDQIAWYMRQSMVQILRCDAMCLLPGWENSRGAKFEREMAVMLRLPQYNLDGERL